MTKHSGALMSSRLMPPTSAHQLACPDDFLRVRGGSSISIRRCPRTLGSTPFHHGLPASGLLPARAPQVHPDQVALGVLISQARIFLDRETETRPACTPDSNRWVRQGLVARITILPAGACAYSSASSSRSFIRSPRRNRSATRPTQSRYSISSGSRPWYRQGPFYISDTSASCGTV